MKKKKLERIKQSVIAECHEDFVGLWIIVGCLEWDFPEQLSDEEIRELTLDIIREVLTMGNIQAGDLTMDGFTPWNLSPDEAVARIEEKWKQLGVRSPIPFEIVALTVWPLDQK